MVAANDKLTQQDTAPDLVVGVGGFTLESLAEVLAAVPEASSLAYIVMTDARDADDQLDLLANQLPGLTITTAVNDAPLRSATVYLLSPEETADVQDGRLVVSERRGRATLGAELDELFRLLARSLRHRCAGLLLGSEAECREGLRELRGVGALTVSLALPDSGSSGVHRTGAAHEFVDLVLPPAEIVPALMRFARLPEWTRIPDASVEEGPESPTAVCIGEPLRSRLAEILAMSRDLELRHYKAATINRRLLRRMGIAGFDDPERYLECVAADQDEREALVRDLLICVTNFFRNPDAFEILSRDIIPQLLESARTTGSIRVWTPGCASGEEPYSIAMLLHEAVRELPEPPEIQIFATDVSSEAIARARLGVYSAEAVAAVPEPLRRQYFESLQDDSFRIAPEIRESVSFAVHDLCTDPPFSRMNLVSCRNVLIYLRTEAQERLGRLFHFALRPGGILFLGASESLGVNASLFDVISKGHRLFRKSAASGPVVVPPSGAGYRQRTYEITPSSAERRSARRSARSSHSDQARDALLSLLPAAVVVDGEGHVIYSHGELSPFLRLPSEPRFELMAMARDSIANRLRGAIYKCRRDHVSVSAVASPELGAPPTRILVSPAPQMGEGAVTVSFAIESDSRERESVEADDPDQRLLIDQLERELTATREDLQHTVEELETANEELRASNEESMSMNEELQSANEELEATTEELRSLNEELSTVNNRLKVKIDEVQRTHDDLSNFFASTNLATVFLDETLSIKRYTPAAEALLDLVPSDIGRRISNFARVLLQRDLAARAQHVLTSFAPVSEEVRLEDGRWFLRRVSPYRTQTRRIEGVVVSFHDVTEQKLATEQLKVRERQQAVLASFGLRSFQTHDSALFVHRVVREVRDITEAQLCRISEFDPASHRLMTVSHVGFEEGAEGLSVDLDTPTGYSLSSSEPVLIDQLSTDSRFSGTRDLIRAGAESGILCVIEDGEAPYGVLEVYGDHAREFSSDVANFVQSVANVLAHSISRARLKLRNALEGRVSQALARAKTPEDATLAVLEAFVADARIDVCEYWVPDPDLDEMVCRSAVIAPKSEAARGEAGGFHERSFKRGEGFVGGIWERGGPEWLESLDAHHGFLRGEQARELGLVSGFGFPVVANDEVRAVLVFLTGRQLLRDPAFVRTLEEIGRSMAQFYLRADAEARLRELAAIVESSEDAVLSKGLDGIIRSWNSGAEALYGYSAEEAVGASVDIIIPDERRGEAQAFIDRIAQGMRVETHDTERVRKDGSRVEVSLMVSPLRDANGVIVGASAVARDISLRKRAEASLRDSQNRLMQAFRSVPFPIFIVSENGEMLLASDRAFELSGFGRDETDRLRHALDPVFGKRAKETYERVRGLAETSAPQHDGTFRIVTATGEARLWDFHSAGMGVLAEGAALSVTVAQDVTEQREAEGRLRDSEWRFRQILVNAPVPMMLYDDTGTILEISKSWKDVFGYGIDEIPDLTAFTDAVFPERAPEIRAFIEDAGARDAVVEDLELKARRRGGEACTLLFNAAPLGRLPDGRSVRVVAAVDITSQKRAEARLVAADQQKDQFLAMLGHELRNPLAAIRSAAEVLHLVKHDDPKLEKSRAILGRQSAHMAKLLDGLLDVTRIARGKIELERQNLDLNEVLEELVDDHQTREAARGTTSAQIRLTSTGPLPVWGDRVRLRQVFDNIIANALKFAPQGEVDIDGTMRDGEIVVKIADNGAGIEEELLPHIFEPFRQASQAIDRADGGLGLGLALVKGLVDLHDGGIVVRSLGTGQGTVVEVTLPADKNAAPRAPKSLDSGGSRRFLVIEDNVDLAEALGDLLQASGHEVTLAHNGREGLAAMSSVAPDVVLCDIGLPGELSGYDVARSIRAGEDTADVLLVALTGYGRSEDKRDAHDAGFDFHLTKPIDLAAIDQILQRIEADDRP